MLKIPRTIFKFKQTQVINAHYIITDFSRLKINNIRDSEQTITLNKFGARLAQLNLVPFALNSAPEIAIHSYR